LKRVTQDATASPDRLPAARAASVSAVAIRDRPYRFRTSDLAGRAHLASAQTDQLFTFFFEKADEVGSFDGGT